MKQTFILRTEWYSSLETLSQKGKSEILDTLFLSHVGREDEINITDPSAKLCWNFMKPTIDYHSVKYIASVENGKKGGRPITQQKPKITQDNLKVIKEETQPNLKLIKEETLKVKPNNNLTGTGTVTGNVTDSVIDYVTATETGIDFDNLDYTDIKTQNLLENYLQKKNIK